MYKLKEVELIKQQQRRECMFLDSLELRVEVKGKDIKENDKVFLLVALLVLSTLRGVTPARQNLFASAPGQAAILVYSDISMRIQTFVESAENRDRASQEMHTILLDRLLLRVTDHALNYYDPDGKTSLTGDL